MTDMFSISRANAERDDLSTDKSLIVFLPKLVVIFVGLMILVDGLLPQLEMAMTGGSLMFAPKWHIFLILGLVSMLLLKGRFQSSTLLPLTLALLSYALLEVLFLHFFKDLSLSSIRRSLEYFVLLLIAGVASIVPLKIKARHILVPITVITFACLLLSASQFLANSPIVPTESADHTFKVESYEFFDRTRAFSFFGNALQAGIFYSLMGGVAASFCMQRRIRKLGLFLLPLCAFGCYATYTRLVMFGFVLTVLAVFVMSRKRLAKFSLLLPFFSLGCAVLLVAQGIRSVGGSGRSNLANSSSLEQRVMDWGLYSKKFLAGTTVDMLFGTGLGPYAPYTKPNRPENAAPVPVDNAYLLILLSTGICGLFVLGVTYWRFWTFLHDRATRSSKSHLLTGITAMFATVPLFCLISDPPTQIVLLLLFAVSVDTKDGATVALSNPTPSTQCLTVA
jgi:hypothetical protein